MLSATAIADYLACHHLTALDRSAAEGEIRRPFFADPGIDLLRRLGLEHERAYLSDLCRRGMEVVEIPPEAAWNEAAERTSEALRQDADAVYQATFLSGDSGGRADFVLKIDEPSTAGVWSYEVIETKLKMSHWWLRVSRGGGFILRHFLR